MTARQTITFIFGFVFCFLVRLLPFRPPNVETVMATQMPFAKQWGAGAGFLFGFASIALFDAILGRIGWWTLITAVAYGLVGVFGSRYFRRKRGVVHYALFATVATVFYDAVTGLTIGPLLFGQPFLAAVLGQIPFTLYHLAGNVGFAVTLSPLIERFITTPSRLDIPILTTKHCVV